MCPAYERTRYRRICCTWILTVLSDSLSSLPSSTTGIPGAAVAISLGCASESMVAIWRGVMDVVVDVERDGAM